jgi:PAS domain S-box-containing protein
MKILIVEDDQLVANALAAVLTNQNYVVEVACDGQAAWDLVESFDYDLILLDVILPKIDGINLCRQIRSKGLQMPILLLTGCDSTHEKAIGLDAGADDYLVKPFDEEELVARIRALLRRGGVASQPVLIWGDLQLDPKSCEVTYGGKHLSLTPKEYTLLELFLRNSRRVFSCGMILEHLWSYEDTPGEEAVRTHIKGLRQKLKAVGASGDLIETVYGIGYRLKQQAQAKPQKGGQEDTERRSTDAKNVEQIPVSTEQQTLLGVAGVWNKFKGRVDEQVSVLEETANALAQKALTQKLRKQAQKEAHTLAGSLGTFGFSTGSKVAKKIEHLLKSTKALTIAQRNELCSLVKQLRQEIEQNSNETVLLVSTGDEQPLLLVVDSGANQQDAPHLNTFAEQIKQESAQRGLKVAIATTIEQARHQLYHQHPSVVLIDPSAFPNQKDSFNLLAELKQRKPPVPVLIFTEKSDFTNRLHMTRTGTHSFLQKPMPMSQVLEAVTQVLQEAPHAEAHVLVVDDDPKIGAVLQTLLSPWGIKVIYLQDPQNFWETLEAVKPDLLILDVEIPEVNGIEICQVVRNDPCWSELPILFLTVHSDADIVNQVFAAGADDFVNKPIVGPELVTRIINRLERIKLRQCINQNYQAKTELNEYHRTQEELRNSQAWFAGIVSIADDAIISIDRNQCITLFNQGAERIFGYSANEVLGKPLDILLPLRHIQVHRQHVADFGQSAKVARRMGERREIYGRRKDGTEFPAEASISKLKLGEEIVYTVYLHDVSDRKQVERMKDEFVSVVSHELRTPLTSIHGSLGMLASGLLKPDSDQGKRLLQIAVDSTERLVRLINDILDIERIESGKVKMEKQMCNVAHVIAQAVNVIQPLADKAGVTLSVSSLSQQLWVDSDRIVQTLTNLLSNAIKFSPQGSTVWLSAEEQAGEDKVNTSSSPSPTILFTIRDRGRGIPADKLDSIFERFQQVDSSDSRNHDGTGLGLAICKSIVQQHGGHIWVESVLGEGSTFYFSLPHLTTSLSPQLPTTSPPHVPLVLVCDDDEEIQIKLQNLLENRGYRVITVACGEAAVAVAASEHPDVILLDLLMPGMNGWETMAVLKERAETQDIPIIICSICSPTYSSQTNLDFVDWVSKPLEESLLFQSLSQVLTNTSTQVRVLLVEDDTDLAEVLMILFKQHGIETFLAKTGKEAIRLSQEVNPDLLILDLVLPECDGFAVVEWLQQHNQLNKIPLMVYSAKELDESERRRLKLGYTEFLKKGQVTAQEFEQRVMDLLQRMTHNFLQDGSHDNKENFGG